MTPRIIRFEVPNLVAGIALQDSPAFPLQLATVPPRLIIRMSGSCNRTYWSKGKWPGIRSACVSLNVLSKWAGEQNKTSKPGQSDRCAARLQGFDFGQINICFSKCFYSRLDWAGCKAKPPPLAATARPRCCQTVHWGEASHLLGQHRGAGPGRYWAGLCGYSSQRQRCQPGLIHLWCSLMRKLVSLNRPLFPLSGAHW